MKFMSLRSGGSRISHGGHGPARGRMDLRPGCFLAKMYAKMKEFGPIGGGMHLARPLDPPMLQPTFWCQLPLTHSWSNPN